MSIFLDDVLINYTLTSPIVPGETGTVYLNETWKVGLGEHILRVASHSIADSVAVRVEKPQNNVLDLTFDDPAESPRDGSGHDNHGKLFGDTILLMHFDEGSGTSAKDETGYGNNGSLFTNAVWSSGVSGGGVHFEGSDSNGRVEIDWTDRTLIAHTISFWMKADELDGLWADLVGTKLNNDINRFHLDSGDNSIFWYGLQSGGSHMDSNVVPEVGRWYHVVGTHNGTSARIYVNGELENSITAGTSHMSEGVWIGGHTESFNGTIDEVSIYNRSLTDSEIKDLYNAGRAKFVEYVDGHSGKALEFDGVDDYVDVEQFVIPTGALTHSFWFSPSATLNSTSSRADLYYGYIPYNRPHITINREGDGKIGMYVRINDTDYYDDVKSTTSQWDADRWYNVVFAFDGSLFHVYVNGDLENTLFHPGPLNTQIGFWLGRLTTGETPFGGRIDEVRIYDRAYAPDELYVVRKA